jgi:sulfur-oxidizing protein SoxY
MSPMMTRRRALVGLGVAGALCAPRRALAQGATGSDAEHQPKLDLPLIAEDSSAVPVQTSVEHPMAADHYIRSIEITLDKDPVPRKGQFVFSADNGRAWFAYTMRSGTGGTVRAVAECSRHGRFTATRDVRVAEGGCAGVEVPDRARLGNPQVRVGKPGRPGDIVEVRARIEHPSHTGLVLKAGKYVRESAEFCLKQMLVFLDDRQISDFQMTAAVSANPIVRFPLRISAAGTLRVVFVNSEDKRWETSTPLRV